MGVEQGCVVAYSVLSSEAWAQQEFGSVKLGDQRLNRRVVKVAAAMAADPGGSIPKQQRIWADIKGTYRLLDHDQATFESLSQAHWQQTRQRCGEYSLVLLIQDTTYLDYSDHPATAGLGWYGRSKAQPRGGQGLLMHGVLAVAPAGDGMGQVLGLAHNKLWARTGDSKRRKRRSAADRTSEDRESLRWRDAVTEVGGAPPGVKYLHVGDREGDFWPLYEQTRQLSGVEFLIRIYHDRNVLEGHETPQTLSSKGRKGTSLKKLLRAQAAQGQKLLWIPPKQGRAGRWVTLNVSAVAVTVYSPQLSRTGRALRCWAVRVWEENAPAGVEPVEWMLLTSMPVNSVEDALQMAEYYGLRWLIEEYHKCLKSGCKVEERQLESADRLAPLIGMLSVVAVRLLQMKNDARLNPDKLAQECVPVELVQTLGLLLKVDPRTLTVRRFVHEVAKRGGFLGRKRDGEPGYLTLWRGWQELMHIHLGYQLARQIEKDVGNA